MCPSRFMISRVPPWWNLPRWCLWQGALRVWVHELLKLAWSPSFAQALLPKLQLHPNHACNVS